MDISHQKNFNVFINTATFYLLELNREEIYCHEAKDAVDVIEYQNYKEHMKYLRKELFTSPNKNEKLSAHGFEYTIGRLQRLQNLKKIFCCFENYYLVKKCFTEGVQYVEQEEIHAYKAIGRPLDIYISNIPLEPKTFKSIYDHCTQWERISPGETKCIPSNTYYAVIAPCHTLFTKEIKNTLEVEHSSEIMPSFATETKREVNSVMKVENGVPFSEQTKKLRMITLPPSPASTDDKYSNPKRSLKFERFDESEIQNGDTSTSIRKSAAKNDRQSKRARSTTPEPKASTSRMDVALVPASPNSLRNEIEYMSTIDHGRAVFAIRKDKNIESYALKSDSTFRILQDDIMTGSFVIENNDMDPYVFEYHGEVQFIREVAKFKNGSTFETTLTVQKDLLNELRDSKRIEKVVVNYFFEFAFKTIEAAYKRFSAMRNTKMLGSCVPAMVSLTNARFFGAVSDAYESKP